ncbi:pseudouridine synthase PUS9 [Sugiyamaella lignohabitans]|uniref:Pseudouridine synthase PUS9 n=1 Tax=Sugiyamaella lignohabitans TaxID=796027 RepID=A0A167D3Z7_9ASCO|nr:pseudouridine synthase PUS9 [Sugiyamaella lignohabitans]ANB12446.1 pseudouridine synthase PUS9 [Sugiyamaella lignohabitans]
MASPSPSISDTPTPGPVSESEAPENVLLKTRRNRSRSNSSSSVTSSTNSAKQLRDGRKRDEGGFRIKRQQIESQSPIGKGAVVSINDEVAQGAQYIIDGPLRRVPPYYFTYLTYCKLRWRDRLLYDIFVTEFRDRDKDYYVSCGGSNTNWIVCYFSY